MTFRLFLDDLRIPYDETWEVARTYEEAVSLVNEKGCPSEISFDHDLGEDDKGNILKSGYDFAQYLINKDMDEDGKFIPYDFEYTIHSANVVGAANINGLLRNYINHKTGNY